jgi:hypothetical protein
VLMTDAVLAGRRRISLVTPIAYYDPPDRPILATR